MVSNERGGERSQSNEEQQKPVKKHESAVRPDYVCERLMVADPQYQYGHEARHEGEELGPLSEQALKEAAPTAQDGILEVEDQQGDRKSEDAVAEGL